MTPRNLAVTAAILVSTMAGQAMAKAGQGVANEPEVGRCITAAAAGRPWLEQTLWGLRDQEGGWVGAEIRNTNGSHDLGILQVNSGWLPRLSQLMGKPQDQIRLWLRFDPCFNTRVGRWLFLSALRQTRDYWRAIGLYHSPTPWRQRRYAASVAEHLRDRYGEDVFGRASRERAIGQ